MADSRQATAVQGLEHVAVTGRARLMAAACLGTFAYGLGLATLGAILPLLFERIGFDKAAAGDLFVVPAAGMFAATLLFGPLVDRFGYKALLVVSGLLVAGAFCVLAAASSYDLVVVAVLLLGFGGGGLNGATNALASDIHDDAARGPALNTLGMFLGIGALVVPFLVGSLLAWLGLPAILLLAGAVSLGPVVFFAAMTFPVAKQPQGYPPGTALRLARNPLLWACAFLVFFQSANEATMAGWASTFVHEEFSLAAGGAALVLGGYWVMLIAGRILASRVLPRMGPAMLVLSSGAVGLAAATLVRLSSSGTVASTGILLAGLGFAAIVPTVVSVVGNAFPRFTGTAFGVVYGVGLLGGMLAPWLAGRMAQVSGLRHGFTIPVVSSLMVILLQLVAMRAGGTRGSAEP